MKKQYVILTGSKNNAGDYLIKYRAKELFKKVRPDREIIDLDAWKPLSRESINLINDSKALILMGGPALQKNMYPGIYPLTENLNDIKVPITAMGIGWKSLSGEWRDTRNYSMTQSTLRLLKRIGKDGLQISVRDYHTLNVIRKEAHISNGVMTGCPATYDLEKMGSDLDVSRSLKKIGFSLGVSFLYSKSIENQMKNLILQLRKKFNGVDFEVVFHHSLDPSFLDTHNATSSHLKGHLAFADWLNMNDISYVDISGSAENLINYYSTCDLHIGYRVHAHIFMNSITKPSLIIAEDGRGKALKNVFGGVVIDAFEKVNNNFFAKVKRRLSIGETFSVFDELGDEVYDILDYEITMKYPRIKASQCAIKSNYLIMERFLKALP